MAGQWPKSQVDAERKRLAATVDSGSVAQTLILLPRDVATIREALKYALESLGDVIAQAERNGQATTTLQEYRADIAQALERFKATK